ncbi:MAG TPA: PAS domain S-box protein [Verrucomicrobiae bacterium]|jgi:PAS domain S-box-containing protein
MSDTAQFLKASISSKQGTPLQPRFEKRLLGLGLLLIVLICAGGWFYFHYQSIQARDAARESLATIADLKADEISSWLKERRGDAEVARTSVIARGVVANPNSPEAHEAAERRAEIFRQVYGYAAVVFADAQGNVILKVPADYPLSTASLNKHIQTALHSQAVTVADLNRDETNGPILMWLPCPIFSSFQTNSPLVGAALLVIDPHTFLYPTINKWPAPSATAETAIVRREGDDVVCLNDLRFRTNSALNLRVSIAANPQLPAVKAVQGIQDVIEGVDYGGMPVFSASRKIAGMPWFLVAKIDKEEVLAPLRQEAWEVGIITALLVLASMLGISLLWRQQKLADVRANEARLQTLIDQAPIAITMSREGKIMYVNRKFLEWYRYPNMDELGGRPITANWAPEFRAGVADSIRRRARGEPVPNDYEGMAQRKDGSQFPVHVAVAPVELPDGVAWLSFITDFTERQHAEQSLKLFRTLIDRSNDSIEVIDPETGRILDVNERALQLHGYSREEYMALTIPEIDPLFAAAGEKSWQAHLETLKQFGFSVFETEHRCKDGTIFPVEVNANYVRLERDYILAVVRDITERKQMEKEGVRLESQFRSLVTDAVIGMTLTTAEGRCTEANPAFCKMVGYTRDELAGSNFQDITHPDDQAATLAALRQTLAGEINAYQLEKRYLHKDGHPVWVQLYVRLVRNPDGSPRHLVAQMQDITERKQMEKERREAEERFRLMIENASDIITAVNHQGEVLFVGPSVKHSLGYEPQELLHKSFLERIDPQDIEKVTAALKQASSDSTVTASVEFRSKHKDGSWRILQSIGRSIPDLSPDGFIVVNSRDMTESRKLETQLRQSQKMDAIGQLAGGVAHDFNNILAVIQMQSDLLKAGGNLSDDQAGLADEIGTAAQRAAALTRQLLLFSRKETAQLQDLDMNTTVNNMTKMLKRVIGADVQVQFKFAMETLFVHADAGMLDQVLMNLVVNARDAMPGGGKIVIETSGMEIDELSIANSPQARTGSFVCLSVSDTGAGIPPEILPKIFEPFFTTKEVGKGTGLGLATVFGIVQQHQGWVTVYSEVGQGTVFRIYLPRIVKASEPLKERPAFNAARGGKETVLIVEDDTALRGAVCKMLWQLGYQVLDAANGPESLLIWKQKRDGIDLLLTDLVMPGGMTGKELAARLLKEKPNLKVVYTSGYSAEIVGKDFPLREGVNFLTKPFQAINLAKTIRDNLDKI